MVNLSNEYGTISITGDVISNLAGDAATSCFGVKGMVGRSKESVSLELHIGVDQGVNIAAVSRSIMKEVGYKLSKATGIPVKSVDVFVDTIIG